MASKWRSNLQNHLIADLNPKLGSSKQARNFRMQSQWWARPWSSRTTIDLCGRGKPSSRRSYWRWSSPGIISWTLGVKHNHWLPLGNSKIFKFHDCLHHICKATAVMGQIYCSKNTNQHLWHQLVRQKPNQLRDLSSSREQSQAWPTRAGHIQLIWQLKEHLILLSAEFQSLSWRLWAEVEPETFTLPSAVLAGICIPNFFSWNFPKFYHGE